MTNLDPFMRQRPEAGKAFYCLGDALALLHIKTTGNVERQSETNTRAISILSKSGLIKATGNQIAPYDTTPKGDALVDVILNLPTPS